MVRACSSRSSTIDRSLENRPITILVVGELAGLHQTFDNHAVERRSHGAALELFFRPPVLELGHAPIIARFLEFRFRQLEGRLGLVALFRRNEILLLQLHVAIGFDLRVIDAALAGMHRPLHLRPELRELSARRFETGFKGHQDLPSLDGIPTIHCDCRDEPFDRGTDRHRLTRLRHAVVLGSAQRRSGQHDAETQPPHVAHLHHSPLPANASERNLCFSPSSVRFLTRAFRRSAVAWATTRRHRPSHAGKRSCPTRDRARSATSMGT